ncbi:hypothetical protein [Streptomyces sp. NRRL F-5053]|uniref:hypothetical protein n=1 Tax=Streptomyces sp. NRRL F-5053 TaxID=1463854 RepID=UPI0013316CA2|nr:hypothetical protein [Streptomyces sp. NRRL F-5053]
MNCSPNRRPSSNSTSSPTNSPEDQTSLSTPGASDWSRPAPKSKPSWIVFQELSLDQAPQADQHFGHREDGWTKVLLHLDGS